MRSGSRCQRVHSGRTGRRAGRQRACPRAWGPSCRTPRACAARRAAWVGATRRPRSRPPWRRARTEQPRQVAAQLPQRRVAPPIALPRALPAPPWPPWPPLPPAPPGLRGAPPPPPPARPARAGGTGKAGAAWATRRRLPIQADGTSSRLHRRRRHQLAGAAPTRRGRRPRRWPRARRTRGRRGEAGGTPTSRRRGARGAAAARGSSNRLPDLLDLPDLAAVVAGPRRSRKWGWPGSTSRAGGSTGGASERGTGAACTGRTRGARPNGRRRSTAGRRPGSASLCRRSCAPCPRRTGQGKYAARQLGLVAWVRDGAPTNELGPAQWAPGGGCTWRRRDGACGGCPAGMGPRAMPERRPRSRQAAQAQNLGLRGLGGPARSREKGSRARSLARTCSGPRRRRRHRLLLDRPSLGGHAVSGSGTISAPGVA
mmetsp:Transcript_6610/g.17921  ORF Transcript_6610/g.17921 Transcript_6610/m.17921 type:complete len:428 (+) Transcript_6610:782-2065(+)